MCNSTRDFLACCVTEGAKATFSAHSYFTSRVYRLFRDLIRSTRVLVQYFNDMQLPSYWSPLNTYHLVLCLSFTLFGDNADFYFDNHSVVLVQCGACKICLVKFKKQAEISSAQRGPVVTLIIITRGKTIDFKVLVNTSVEGLQEFLTGVERV